MHAGKTNHGQKLHGRTMGHNVVELHAVGGLAFCLTRPFWLRKEFEEFGLEDFLDNKKWLDVDLQQCCSPMSQDWPSHDHAEALADGSCAKAVKQVQGKRGSASNHWLHLGRRLGFKLPKLLEPEQDAIWQLGNWDPKT
jgi:hypothetical protein